MDEKQIHSILKLIQAGLDTERLLRKWQDSSFFTKQIETELAHSRLALFQSLEEVWTIVSETKAAKAISEGGDKTLWKIKGY
jgi:hypothetical protein